MANIKRKNRAKTTFWIENYPIVKLHLLKIGETIFADYLNELIKKDILKNGDEETIKKYFKKEI